MATVHEGSRKKFATYGKAARRRVNPVNSGYSSVFFGQSSKSQTPEQDIQETLPAGRISTHSTEHQETKQAIIGKPAILQRALSATTSSNIFDVPDDETPPPKVAKPIARPIARSLARAKTTPNFKSTVYDVPSSDEEKSNPVAKMKKHTMKSTIPTTRTLSSPKLKEPAKVVATVIDQSRLYRAPPQKAVAAAKAKSTTIQVPKSAPEVSVSKTFSQPVKMAPSVPSSRTNTQVPKTISERNHIAKANAAHARKQSSTPESNTLSPQLSDVDMMEVDPQSNIISPKGLKLWKDLLDPEDEATITSNRLEKRGLSPAKKSPPTKPLLKPAGISKPAQKSPRHATKKRLIDLLAEQASNDDSEEDSEESEDDVRMEGVESNSDYGGRSISRGPSLVPEVAQASASASQASQISGPKFVYGRERTILAEQDFMQALHIEMPTDALQGSTGRRTRRGSIPTLPALPSFHDVDLEDDEGNGATIKSVHELRQAGVNNRFLDELDDFIERIGSPGTAQISMRRSGLLDLANRLKDKAFARQFRSNGAEERLFVHLGQETDVVAGFILVAILMAIFTEGNVAHMIPQLRRQGVTRLLIRLLEIQNGIVAIGKERKSNMSKIAQSLLAEYHDHLLQLPIWEDLKPQNLTPRTIALKCLEKMVRHTREAGNPGDIFSKELTSKLFDVLKNASNERVWDLPQGQQAIDFFLALSALESHSITAKTANNEDIWVGEFLPVIAETLQIALSQNVFGTVQPLILRLALNVTNNNPKGADIFARPSLLTTMGQVVVTRFKILTRFLPEKELYMVVDYLVLTLGVMINFAEWSDPARQALQGLEGRSDDPLDRMAQIFLDNWDKMADADSVEDSQKNVAFGYLSVLLGYLALHPPIAKRIQKRTPRGSLQPVVSSIEEFISHHKTVDEIIAADPDGHSPHSGLTERLESLVARLRSVI